MALLGEFVIATVLMYVVLYTSNHPRLARYTGVFVGTLVTAYISVEAPLSGMSMNPARTFQRLQSKLKQAMKQTHCSLHGAECHQGLFSRSLYAGQRIPLAGVAHQNGTIRFGRDPKTSALDIHCKAHDLDNLYVVDGSFFPSSAAVNPALTIMANALRVGDHLMERLGVSLQEYGANRRHDPELAGTR